MVQDVDGRQVDPISPFPFPVNFFDCKVMLTNQPSQTTELSVG